MPFTAKIISSSRHEGGGEGYTCLPRSAAKLPDRVLPLRHLPGRLHADNYVYSLLDMDSTSGGEGDPLRQEQDLRGCKACEDKRR